MDPISVTDKKLWSVLGTLLTGGVLTYKVFMPNMVRDLRFENLNLQNKIESLQNQVSELNLELSNKNRQVSTMTHESLILTRENKVLAQEIKTSGRGDLFLLYSEVKRQLSAVTSENASLKSEAEYLRPLAREINEERDRNKFLEVDNSNKIREISKLSRDLDDLNRKFRNLSSENERLNRNLQYERKRDRYDRESTSEFEKTSPRIINQTITNQNFIGTQTTKATEPKKMSNQTKYQTPPTLKVDLQYSSDDASKDKADQFQAKLKNKFGLNININFKILSDEEDAFEIYVDNKLIFSKKQACTFPDLDVVVRSIDKVYKAVSVQDRQRVLGEIAANDGCVIC